MAGATAPFDFEIKSKQSKNGSPGDRVQCRGSCLWEVGLEEAETAWHLVSHAYHFCHGRVSPQASWQALLPRPEGVRTCHPRACRFGLLINRS